MKVVVSCNRLVVSPDFRCCDGAHLNRSRCFSLSIVFSDFEFLAIDFLFILGPLLCLLLEDNSVFTHTSQQMQQATPYGDEPQTSQMIGQSIRLEKRIGVGSSGEVWLATAIVAQHQLPSFVRGDGLPPSFALKIIRSEQMRSARLQQLVHQEIQSLKQLKHPYINAYVASWMERSDDPSLDGCFCIATQFCAGGDLRTLIHKRCTRHQPFPTDAVMFVAAQLLSACAFAHSQKLLHRDIKPGNIFVKSGAEGITLGDFGLSRELETTLDCAVSRVGTPNYCSPQVVMGDPYTAKTDVWSVGVVLYEMMAFQRPFSSAVASDDKVFQRIVYDDPIPTLKTLTEGRYTNTLVNIVDAALSKREEDRPTALELLTTFSGTFGQFVKHHNIPLPTARTSPMRKVAVPLPERTSSPLRFGGAAPVVAPAAKATSPLRQRATPTATPAGVTPAKALKHGSKSADSKSVQQVSDMVSSLLESMPSITNPTTAATAADIYVALHNDDELFLLTKVLLLTRQGKARSHVEDGLFKLLVAMRPEVDAQKAIDLILPNTPHSAVRGG
jgi:serine/threonine protein kinase